jgi:hypothetical protein
MARFQELPDRTDGDNTQVMGEGGVKRGREGGGGVGRWQQMLTKTIEKTAKRTSETSTKAPQTQAGWRIFSFAYMKATQRRNTAP